MWSFSHPNHEIHKDRVRRKLTRKEVDRYISSPKEISEVIIFMSDLFDEVQNFETDYL